MSFSKGGLKQQQPAKNLKRRRDQMETPTFQRSVQPKVVPTLRSCHFDTLVKDEQAHIKNKKCSKLKCTSSSIQACNSQQSKNNILNMLIKREQKEHLAQRESTLSGKGDKNIFSEDEKKLFIKLNQTRKKNDSVSQKLKSQFATVVRLKEHHTKLKEIDVKSTSLSQSLSITKAKCNSDYQNVFQSLRNHVLSSYNQLNQLKQAIIKAKATVKEAKKTIGDIKDGTVEKNEIISQDKVTLETTRDKEVELSEVYTEVYQNVQDKSQEIVTLDQKYFQQYYYGRIIKEQIQNQKPGSIQTTVAVINNQGNDPFSLESYFKMVGQNSISFLMNEKLINKSNKSQNWGQSMNNYQFDSVIYNKGLSYFEYDPKRKVCEDIEIFLTYFLYIKPSYVLTKISFDRNDLFEILNQNPCGKVYNIKEEYVDPSNDLKAIRAISSQQQQQIQSETVSQPVQVAKDGFQNDENRAVLLFIGEEDLGIGERALEYILQLYENFNNKYINIRGIKAKIETINEKNSNEQAQSASNIEYPDRFVRHVKATLRREKISTQKDRNLARLEHAFKGIQSLKLIAELPQFIDSSKQDINQRYNQFRMMVDIICGMRM